MNLQFLGAGPRRSSLDNLLRTDTASVLVDCGLFQGYKQLRLRNWSPLPRRPAGIDAVVLAHAHLDHSGYVPLLVRQGFRGPVYCTPATLDLCPILLTDSGHLLEEEAQYLNEHRLSKNTSRRCRCTRVMTRCVLSSCNRGVGSHLATRHGMDARFSHGYTCPDRRSPTSLPS